MAVRVTISRANACRPTSDFLIERLMSHMLGSSAEDVWTRGRVPATCKSGSVRALFVEKAAVFFLLGDHASTASIWSLSGNGAMIYATNTVGSLNNPGDWRRGGVCS